MPEQSQGVQAWNRYAYVSNNPILHNDPTGHCIDPDSCTPKPKEKYKKPHLIPPDKVGDFDNDKFGRQILMRYLMGGSDWNIVYDPEWTDYMSNNPTLKQDLKERAIRDAEFMYKKGYSKIFINQTYPMEIENGEAIIGYQYLHGTDATVGDFHRLGGANMKQKSNGGYDVAFSMSYTWNDTIDPNLKYTSDQQKSDFAKLITLGQAAAYKIHISWSQTFVIHLDANGNATP